MIYFKKVIMKKSLAELISIKDTLNHLMYNHIL
jgi:hypothetical protein